MPPIRARLNDPKALITFSCALFPILCLVTLTFLLPAPARAVTPLNTQPPMPAPCYWYRSCAPTPLNTLYPQHPRQFLHDSDVPAIKHAVATDPLVKQLYDGQLAIGERLLKTPPHAYHLGGATHNLLGVSRDMEGRILTLAGLYRINGQKRFADRAIQEMLAAASFPDWNPRHFLDTAEMTAGLGIGYDWLYSVLTPEQRHTIEHAIATKGMDPWLELINNHPDKAAHIEYNNWNQVCNGGESIAALALADVYPQRAEQILNHARLAIGDIMGLFAPDGGFEEGPGYWSYATTYNVLFIDALDSALGTDFGMAQMPGFSDTGDYHIQATGPTDLAANFNDANTDVPPSFQMLWLAHRFNKPFYAAHEREIIERAGLRSEGRFGIFLLVWAARDANLKDGHPLPLIESFKQTDQVYMRSAWSDPNAWYVAFKGGPAHASHGHLDFGSFILDAEGQRWASDLGADSYGLPGYFNFGGQRFTYYRTSTEGHNTLTIDGQNEDLDTKAPLTVVSKPGNTLYALVDLSQAYKGKLTSWFRGISLLNKQRVLVQDEIRPAQPVDVVWNFHTFASVKIAPDGRHVMLIRSGKTLEAHILSPAHAHFSIVSAQPPPPNSPNPGVTNLVISLPHQVKAETIAVLFTKPGDTTRPVLKPLSRGKGN